VQWHGSVIVVCWTCDPYISC